MPNKLTPTAIESLGEKYCNMLLDEERMAEGGYDVWMTSTGYVNLWTDGEVTAACGGLLGKFDDDGDWTPNEDGDDAEGG
jgi:hypothetical protein